MGQTSSRKFGLPEYVLQRPSQLRGDIWAVRRRPCGVNNLARASVEQALLCIVSQDTNNNRHVNIARCPRIELVKYERGLDETKTKRKLHPVDTGPSYYHIRWMGEISVHREHLCRAIRDLEV